MIKVGIIGCGIIAQAHAKGWAQIQMEGKAQVLATCDADRGRAGLVAEKLGADAVYDRWEDVLRSDVQAVDICLPHFLHRDAIVAAAEAGKHVMIEKPLCLSLKEAEDIREAKQKSGITIMCAHNQLFHPAVGHARKAIEEGRIGKVLSARTVDCFHISRTAEQWGWRAKVATAGGGCLIDTGYHPSYLLLYLVGARPTAVAAMNGNYAQPMIEGEDSANVLVRFEGGAVGNIFTSWAWDVPGSSWQFQVTGEKGQMYGRGSRFFFKPLKSEPIEESMTAVDAFEAEVAHFVACLEGGTRPLQTEEDGITVLKVILAAYESNQEQKVVQIA